jgi:uncharacterized protein DUF2427
MRSLLRNTTAFVVLALLPAALGHGDEHGHDAAMGHSMADEGHDHAAPDAPTPGDEYPDTYFALADHAGLMYAHIALMILAWIFVLPVGE